MTRRKPGTRRRSRSGHKKATGHPLIAIWQERRARSAAMLCACALLVIVAIMLAGSFARGNLDGGPGHDIATSTSSALPADLPDTQRKVLWSIEASAGRIAGDLNNARPSGADALAAIARLQSEARSLGDAVPAATRRHIAQRVSLAARAIHHGDFDEASEIMHGLQNHLTIANGH